MTEREYRQDDTTDAYCDCGEPLSNVTVGGRGFCEIHGWRDANWRAPSDRDPGDETDDDGTAESQEGLYTAWEMLGE